MTGLPTSPKHGGSSAPDPERKISNARELKGATSAFGSLKTEHLPINLCRCPGGLSTTAFRLALFSGEHISCISEFSSLKVNSLLLYAYFMNVCFFFWSCASTGDQ